MKPPDEWECERCSHQLVRGHYSGGWIHWDEDEWYDGCPCEAADAECIPVRHEYYQVTRWVRS